MAGESILSEDEDKLEGGEETVQKASMVRMSSMVLFGSKLVVG